MGPSVLSVNLAMAVILPSINSFFQHLWSISCVPANASFSSLGIHFRSHTSALAFSSRRSLSGRLPQPNMHRRFHHSSERAWSQVKGRENISDA